MVANIFLTGDTHGNALQEMRKLSRKRFKGTAEDILIILGDFGFLFHNKRTKEEQYWLDWLENTPWTTLFLDGNHENFTLLNALPVEQKFGSSVGKVSDSIFHLHRGQVYTIFEKTFFVMGGAISIDKEGRTPYVSWWPEEEPNYTEWQQAIQKAKEVGKVDYILTHEVPSCVYDELDYNVKLKNSVSEGVQELKNILEYKWGFSGHHHFEQDFHQHRWSIVYGGIIDLAGKLWEEL